MLHAAYFFLLPDLLILCGQLCDTRHFLVLNSSYHRLLRDSEQNTCQLHCLFVFVVDRRLCHAHLFPPTSNT